MNDHAESPATDPHFEAQVRERIMARLDAGEPVAVWMYGELKKRGLSHDDILLELGNRI